MLIGWAGKLRSRGCVCERRLAPRPIAEKRRLLSVVWPGTRHDVLLFEGRELILVNTPKVLKIEVVKLIVRCPKYIFIYIFIQTVEIMR